MKFSNLSLAFALAMATLFTACSSDETNESKVAPTITSTNPTNNAIEVPRNKVITIEFSEAMDTSTINASSFIVTDGKNDIEGAITLTGTTASFTPSTLLNPSANFTATLTTEASGTTGIPIESNMVWSFSSGILLEEDVFAPTVLLTNPLADAIDVAGNKIISVNFSETMDPKTINGSTFFIKKADVVVEGNISYSGTTAKFISKALLAPESLYTVTVTTDAKDVAGNALKASTELAFTTSANEAGMAVVDLGEAGNYVILAKTAINNAPSSGIIGNLGLSPAATSYYTGLALTDFTGYATAAQVSGKLYAADMASPTPVNLTTAVENMITAYNDAAGRVTPDYVELEAGNIGGQTLRTGLYKWSNTVIIPTDVTISGTADDVWIFQISGDLTMSSAVNIILEGGAKASNIFWQVAGETTLGTNAHFEGIILSMTGITLQTGASLNGRALAQTAVILDGNTVVQPQ